MDDNEISEYLLKDLQNAIRYLYEAQWDIEEAEAVFKDTSQFKNKFENVFNSLYHLREAVEEYYDSLSEGEH